MEEIIRKLVELYILNESPLELNLSDDVRKSILDAYANDKTNMRIFRKAIVEVYWMLKSNVYRSWLDSHEFKELRLLRTSPTAMANAQKRRTVISPQTSRYPLGLDPVPAASGQGAVEVMPQEELRTIERTSLSNDIKSVTSGESIASPQLNSANSAASLVVAPSN